MLLELGVFAREPRAPLAPPQGHVVSSEQRCIGRAPLITDLSRRFALHKPTQCRRWPSPSFLARFSFPRVSRTHPQNTKRRRRRQHQRRQICPENTNSDIAPVAPTHILIIPKTRNGLTQLRHATAEHAGMLGHMLEVAAHIAKEEELEGFRWGGVGGGRTGRRACVERYTLRCQHRKVHPSLAASGLDLWTQTGV